MKTFFTLFASLFLSIAVFAAANPRSVLSIQSADRTDIRVVLDGKTFESNDHSIVIRGIDDGKHNIRVYRQKRNGIFNLTGKGYELVYNSTIHVKKRTQMSITIERNGRANVSESKIQGNRKDDDRYGRDYDYGRDGKWGDYDYNEAHARAMNDREFSSVIASIEKEWLESNKMKSASQVVKNSNLTTAQVEQLILLFSFENNKLQLAKDAYDNTVDKRNYRRLLDLFSFNSSKIELERYINRR